MKHLKTLVIHPDDRSTDFLSAIYADLPNKTVVTGSSTPSEVRRMIQTHERVMMMGHGTPGGLMAMSQFPADDPTPIYSVVKDRYYEPKPAYIIDSETVAVLRPLSWAVVKAAMSAVSTAATWSALSALI